MDIVINWIITKLHTLYDGITPTLFIAVLALAVATKNYLRKSNIMVSGMFTVSRDEDCSQNFISKVVLENCKDRPVIIYSIYLNIGLNYYIRLEDFNESPIILKPYEVLERSYGPILFYTNNISLLKCGPLLLNKDIKKQIVLSTNLGKYTVPARPKRWDAVNEKFKNRLVEVVRPARMYYKERAIGDRVKYIVDIEDGEKSKIFLLKDNPEFHFPPEEIELGREILKSSTNLEEHYESMKEQGIIPSSAIVKVLRTEPLVENGYRLIYRKRVFEPRVFNSMAKMSWEKFRAKAAKFFSKAK
ncbi:TPA: hypothetical protein ACXNP4_004877 [Pseudomonas aeruginosa]|nr:hypothetical protein [Pseudomonas aeruginosa]